MEARLGRKRTPTDMRQPRKQRAFYLIGLRTHSIAAFNSDTGYSP